MSEIISNTKFTEMDISEEQKIDGGIAPVIVFLGKAVLAGVSWGIGYWAVDSILN